MSLVPVHGGLAEPVDLVLPLSKAKALAAEAIDMPRITVTNADRSAVYRFSDGTLSPLTGPMNEDEWNQVLARRNITRDGVDYAWTIPMALPITDAEAAKLQVGRPAAIIDSTGSVIGMLKVGSVYDWDKAAYIKSVYATERTDHPGGDIVTSDARTKLVGGEIQTLPTRRTRASPTRCSPLARPAR